MFKGLFIDSIDWEWEEYPVLRIDLNKKRYSEMGGLDPVLDDMFSEWEERYGIVDISTDMSIRFEKIIKTAHLSTGKQVVILVDEYDKPLRKYCHTDKKIKDALYQLIDCYTLFYYNFVKNTHGTDENYWLKLTSTHAYSVWCGVVFERVCLLHTKQIKSTLGISGIMANIFSWHIAKTEDHPGVQIDLLIDRADNVVSICEMKYAPNGYTMTASEANKINTRMRVYSLHMPSRKGLQFVMITSNGVRKSDKNTSCRSHRKIPGILCGGLRNCLVKL